MIRFSVCAFLILSCVVVLVSCGKNSSTPKENTGQAVSSSNPDMSQDVANASVKSQRIVKAGILHNLAGPEKNAMEMPSDVAVGDDGTVFIVDGVNNRIMVFDSDGRYKSAFGKRGSKNGELSLPLGIAVGGGNVYVADTGNRRIQVFTADGAFSSSIPLESPEAEKPTDVTDIALDPNGQVFYAVDNDNHRVLTGSINGETSVTVWGGPGLGEREFRYPFLIDTTARGYVLVVEAINTRVQALNARGKFVSFVGEWGIRPGQLFRPKGVATSGDRVFVSDSYLGRIQAFRLDGEFLGELSDDEGTPYKFRGPVGISAGPDNRLYVVEMFANSVCALQLEEK